ncbi:hypothetical protein BaRGS_00022940 [Batillaria attramentaria]|uniref:Uncharacterized protein n=1 Tax=Batillaria attramentaria TaxID=370345 RepID=A0ABD0KFS7_9CAEN
MLQNGALGKVFLWFRNVLDKPVNSPSKQKQLSQGYSEIHMTVRLRHVRPAECKAEREKRDRRTGPRANEGFMIAVDTNCARGSQLVGARDVEVFGSGQLLIAAKVHNTRNGHVSLASAAAVM